MSEECKQIQKRIADSVADNSCYVNRIIYHFTTPDSFLKIIDTKTFLSTDLRYMNDRSEFYHGIEKIRSLVTKNANLIQYFDLAVNKDMMSNHDIFVTSFSETVDQILHWKAYSCVPYGIAIGFLTSGFQEPWGATPVRVVYSNEDKNSVINNLVDCCRGVVSEFENHVQTCKCLKFSLWSAVSHLAIRMKDESFQEEQEWRLVQVGPRETFGENVREYRVNSGALIPYYKWTPMKKLPIYEVVCGPGGYVDLQMDAIKELMKINGFSSNIVRRSEVPLRW